MSGSFVRICYCRSATLRLSIASGPRTSSSDQRGRSRPSGCRPSIGSELVDEDHDDRDERDGDHADGEEPVDVVGAVRCRG